MLYIFGFAQVPNMSTTRDIKELGRYILERTTNYFIVEFELVRKV